MTARTVLWKEGVLMPAHHARQGRVIRLGPANSKLASVKIHSECFSHLNPKGLYLKWFYLLYGVNYGNRSTEILYYYIWSHGVSSFPPWHFSLPTNIITVQSAWQWGHDAHSYPSHVCWGRIIKTCTWAVIMEMQSHSEILLHTD